MSGLRCPYCGLDAELVGGDVIYPHRPDLRGKKFWSCHPCQAYVGCHDGTINPLGRLANAELRAAKIRAHAAFDPLWMRGGMQRRAAYLLLAKRMGIPASQCHIGMFDVSQCEKVVDVLADKPPKAESKGE